jgi:hypothetical protein
LAPAKNPLTEPEQPTEQLMLDEVTARELEKRAVAVVVVPVMAYAAFGITTAKSMSICVVAPKFTLRSPWNVPGAVAPDWYVGDVAPSTV